MGVQRTSNNNMSWLALAFMIGAMAVLNACSPKIEVPTSSAKPFTCPECDTLVCPVQESYQDLWSTSAHADAEAEAFTHWNEDKPQEIPVDCAKCHSRPGLVDYLGIDGTTINQVNNPAKTGTTITCYVCHNEAFEDLASVVFPSGATLRLLGPEVRCILCHQGRASTSTVDKAIAELALVDLDVPSTELEFINSHSTSAATPFGTEVQGAYQYAGNTYKGRFNRGEDFFSCLDCHNQHSLELKFETCGECHAITGTDPRDIRVDTTDYDGDGDISEGIAYEISAIQETLYTTIKAYSMQIIGIPIAYDLETHPYYFIDTNNNGLIDLEENLSDNVYNAWTPRLLRAAYNYNYLTHDPGAYAHNSDYVLQILYDSIDNLGGDVTGMSRP